MDDLEETSSSCVIKRPKIDMEKEMDEHSMDEFIGIDRTSDFCRTDPVLYCQGAEARLYRATYLGKAVIVKERFPKMYRHPILDDHLRGGHMRSEIRCMTRCRSVGVDVPPLYFVDPSNTRIVMGFIDDAVTVREYIFRICEIYLKIDDRQRFLFPLAEAIGRLLALVHSNDVIHGDLTTSNMLVRSPEFRDESIREWRLVLIDFGLSYTEHSAEDKGVDLYVLEKAFLSTHPETETIFDRILSSYRENCKNGGEKTLDKLNEVRLRGRKREMIG